MYEFGFDLALSLFKRGVNPVKLDLAGMPQEYATGYEDAVNVMTTLDLLSSVR